jgi:hypothetical protein
VSGVVAVVCVLFVCQLVDCVAFDRASEWRGYRCYCMFVCVNLLIVLHLIGLVSGVVTVVIVCLCVLTC